MIEIEWQNLERALMRACVSEVREVYDLHVSHSESLQEHIEMNKFCAEQLFAQMLELDEVRK